MEVRGQLCVCWWYGVMCVPRYMWRSEDNCVCVGGSGVMCVPRYMWRSEDNCVCVGGSGVMCVPRYMWRSEDNCVCVGGSGVMCVPWYMWRSEDNCVCVGGMGSCVCHGTCGGQRTIVCVLVVVGSVCAMVHVEVRGVSSSSSFLST
ncbi:hypothetical protein LEMLEM_LOCUS11576 [Lemmus lemmus]